MQEEPQCIDVSDKNLSSLFEEPRITEQGTVEFGECSKSAIVCQI